jgi:two-component system, chemotaxis family, chemotaxis protein CheY
MSNMSRSVSGARRRAGPVLLVDDSADARSAVRDALEEAGHVVIEAADGQQALNVLVSPERYVALIILDLQMPIMDGWRFIELLSCYVKLSHIPIIVVTAAAQPQLERIKHKAVYGCLQAPYGLGELLSMIDSCLCFAPPKQRSTDTA